MLHVFLVDTGFMVKLEMELAAENVSVLMDQIFEKIFISPCKQVLISAKGEPLNPDKRVASYASAGTENQPIFLFSKSTIQSPLPPSPSVNLGSEQSLKDEIDRCLKLPPVYETLVARAKLASDFQTYALELGESCENLITDQNFQSEGWQAAIVNLDHITTAFEKHLESFKDSHSEFVTSQVHYNTMLQNFGSVLDLLKRVPLLPSLHKQGSQISLLQWISAHDHQSSLENLVSQCQDAVHQFNSEAIRIIVSDAELVLDSTYSTNMKEIRGLKERLVNLQHRLEMAKRLVQDQCDMAQGFQQNRQRAANLGDSSILPDLCSSHQKQLYVLMKNHHRLREIRNVCARAKDELSVNLHTRLKWVMAIEKQLCACNSKILVFHDCLKRIKKRLDIFEQVYEAPRLYVLAVVEATRRKSFSKQFYEWSRSVSESSKSTRKDELNKRQIFHRVFGRHFIQNLFPGLDETPQPFAEEAIKMCDDILPDISACDIQILQDHAPELMSEFAGAQIRSCVSPNARDKFKQQMTMSVLKREITDNFPVLDNVEFQVGSSPDEEDYEPISLRSLSDKLKISDDSDTLFQSAELELPSLNSSPEKSISSPIAIQTARKPFSDSHDNHVPTLASSCRKHVKTNSLSLADAIKSSEVNENISHSAELVKNAKHEVTTLKSRLRHVQEDFRNIHQATNDELNNVREKLLGLCKAQLTCENCVKLQNERQNYETNHIASLEEVNKALRDELRSVMLTLDDKCADVKEKTDIVNALKLEIIDLNAAIETRKYEANECKERADNLLRVSNAKDSLVENLQRDVERYAEETKNRERQLQASQDHICTLNLQIKELNKKQKEDIDCIRQASFNQVLNKVKREKQTSIDDLQGRLAASEKDVSALRLNVQRLQQEISTHKDGYNLLEVEAQRDKQKMTEKLVQLKCDNNELKDVSRTRCEKLQRELSDARESLDAEKVRITREMKARYDADLASERASILLACEVEKESVIEKYGRPEHVLTRESSSLEEGIDELEIDRLSEKVTFLEDENLKLKKAIEKQPDVVDYMERLRNVKVSCRKIIEGAVVVLVFDDVTKQYVALSLSETKCFAHPETIQQLFAGKTTEQPWPWMLAEVLKIEWCMTKKASNKYHLPTDATFMRVYVKPYSPSNSPSVA